MSKRVSKGALRDFALTLRLEALGLCEQAHVSGLSYYETGRLRGGSEARKVIANRLDALLDGSAVAIIKAHRK